MTDPTPPIPDDEDAADRAARALHARALAEMVEGGLQTVQAMRERLLGLIRDPGDVETRIASLSLALDRSERSLRRTIALSEKVREGVLVREQEARAQRKVAAEERAAKIAKARNAVADAAFDIIHTAERAEGAYERLSDDTEDWIEAAGDDAFFERPIGEMLARLCKDLGLPLDLSEFGARDWAQAEVIARTPTSPYIRFRHRDAAGPCPVFWGREDDDEDDAPSEPACLRDAAKPP